MDPMNVVIFGAMGLSCFVVLAASAGELGTVLRGLARLASVGVVGWAIWQVTTWL
jgi:hypothetical protein